MSVLELKEKDNDNMDIDDNPASEPHVLLSGIKRTVVSQDRRTVLLSSVIKGVTSAERNKYIQKYEHPHYTDGSKGLINQPQTCKYEATTARWNLEEESISSIESDSTNRKKKPMRMRMYADDEELKIRLKSKNAVHPQKRSIHSRLGIRNPSYDLMSTEDYQDLDKYPREISDNFSQKPEDLRSKLKRKRNYKSYDKYESHDDREDTGYANYQKYNLVDDLREDFIQKYRSPLCRKDDDDDDSSSKSD